MVGAEQFMLGGLLYSSKILSSSSHLKSNFNDIVSASHIFVDDN